MEWQVNLIGEAMDITELARIAPVFGVTFAPDRDGRQCIGGPRFSSCITVDEVRAKAGTVLRQLNGIARTTHANHRPVQLGSGIARVDSDGRRHITFQVEPGQLRLRGGDIGITITRADGTIETKSSVDADIERAGRIARSQKLSTAVEALAGEKSWQKLRVAFENITALVGGKRKRYGSLEKNGYATNDELRRFIKNIEDPRLSGIEAVHGVADTHPLNVTKMTVDEGFAFVVRLLNTYLDRMPP